MRYVLLVFILISTPALAQPYIEWKNEVKYTDSHYDKTINYFRAGMKFENDTYFEFGPMTDGESFETGYKWKDENWKFKMKWEGKNTESLKHKVETEIRYTFK
jgi:hypothetical protein